MEINCPHGWKTEVKLNQSTWEDCRVESLGGVCDAAHHCGITHCKFYDASPEGDARFIVALKQRHSLKGLRETLQRH